MTQRSTLLSALDSWMIRDDIAGDSDIDTIIQMAESRLNRLCRTVIQEQSTTLTFTGRSEDLPANYLEWRMVFIDDNVRKMDYKTPKALRESSSWSDGRKGRFFTIEGGGGTPGSDDRMQMTIASPGTASDSVTVTLLYWAKWTPLVDPTDTNWLLTNHFDIYLYAALRVAAEWANNDEKEDRYELKFQKMLGELNNSQNKGRFGAGPHHSSGSPRAII